jgi:hypothetical protein
MERRQRGIWTLMAGLSLAALLPLGSARAQDEAEPPPVDLGPIARPVAVYLVDRPLATVTFRGDYGPTRLTGLLDALPKDTIQITNSRGKTRNTTWTEVRGLTRVETATEGFPAGSYMVRLSTEQPNVSTTALTGDYAAPELSTPDQPAWRAMRVPEGDVTLRGESYGTLSVPLNRIEALYMEPERFSIVQLPKGTLRLEVLSGKPIDLPLEQVQSLRRDVATGTAVVTLNDGQMFTGKVLQLPNVSITSEPPTAHAPIPLDRIVELTIRRPAIGGALGAGPR